MRAIEAPGEGEILWLTVKKAELRCVTVRGGSVYQRQCCGLCEASTRLRDACVRVRRLMRRSANSV